MKEEEEEEAGEGETLRCSTKSLIRASGVGLIQLRHCENLMTRRSGWQEEGRRDVPRHAMRKAPSLRVVGRLLRALDDLVRAAANVAEAADAI
jgi:hypothetical protein